MTDLLGRSLLNRYRVIESLGRGGNAEVYKVWDSHRSSFLAMKVLHADLALDRVFIRRFKREAQTLARLQHPNIVRFYDLEQDGRLVFMLMEYVEGESLKHKIFDANGPMPFTQILEVMRPLCQALHFAHKEGFVHSDVKPGNILMDKSGRVMLTDFGIARMTEAATVTMLGAGTPAYMAPEQARGEGPTPQTDIYALGVILFEMLTGERPFTGENAKTAGSTSEKVRWEQINLPVPSPRTFNPNVLPELEAVVLKCLEKEPQNRYSNALEILTALQKALSATMKAEPPLPNLDDASTIIKKRPAAIYPKRTVPSYVWMILVSAAVLAILIFARGYIAKPLVPTLTPTTTSAPATDTPVPVFTLTPTPTELPSIATLTPTPGLVIGSTEISPEDGMVMMYVPSGEFAMGSNSGYRDESPVHTIYLDSYWIDQTEVTNVMYTRCVQAGVCQPPSNTSSHTRSSYYGNPEFDNYPVIYVNWKQANTYCEWAGRKLPTEAEWEKASRGTNETDPWWEDEINCNKSKYFQCTNDTAEVGSYSDGISPLGAYDTVGNVWEWVSDWYSSQYYSVSPKINPQGPSSGEFRALRGGFYFFSNHWFNRGTLRSGTIRSYIYDYEIGFRCARSQ
jgi:serine/threonine protein kinase